MIDFFFKPKTITLDCFTHRAEVFKFAPIQKATKFYPEWWKDLKDPEDITTSNMRHCAGFIDFYKKGIILPLWSELLIQVAEEGNPSYLWQFADRTSDIETHAAHQRGTFLPEGKYQHFKIVSPWLFKSNRYVDFAFVKPTWNFSNPEDVIIFNAVDNYKYQASTNVNLAIRKGKTPKRIVLPFLQPLINLIPMTEAKVKIKTHLVSTEERDKIESFTKYECSFQKSYYTCKRIKENKND